MQDLALKVEQAIELNELGTKGDEMVHPEVAKIILAFKEATDKIAARIQKLIDAGLNAETLDALKAEVATLNALGTDPENPIPPNV